MSEANFSGEDICYFMEQVGRKGRSSALSPCRIAENRTVLPPHRLGVRSACGEPGPANSIRGCCRAGGTLATTCCHQGQLCILLTCLAFSCPHGQSGARQARPVTVGSVGPMTGHSFFLSPAPCPLQVCTSHPRNGHSGKGWGYPKNSCSGDLCNKVFGGHCCLCCVRAQHHSQGGLLERPCE